ncbi:putative P-loop containing nucleoside triphosphate hydrolase, leucine-rich repeat domain superfamily [Helianthus annuus]|nr:putative P-loop containing nucleoside triphosphate hydrolase, leucine-rich repeat domain superfamily [Helianthus annuus]
MGGVGKTTLDRLLYDDKKVKNHFELNAWVCVSYEFDSFNASKVIFQSVTGGEIFLLVLDDTWIENYEDWVTLVGPLHACALGSKIIITTRKEQLLKKLGYGHLNHRLQTLSPDDALSLLALHALGVKNFDSHLSLQKHGEGIVKKCDGLLLALIALGRLLRKKEFEEEYWNEVLNNEIWRLQNGGGIIPALRLSYHDLSSCLKQLFIYCSLFPKDYMFEKEELVLLWMVEGFLHQSTPSDTTEEHLGHEYFDELLSRSFFQHAPNSESLFVMHDLMNDLATSMASEFFVRLDNETEKIIKRRSWRNIVVCHLFVRSLRTFLATSIGGVESSRSFYLSNKIMVDLLPKLPLLRVLCLSHFQISEVPESIGTMRHLRYLNLSQTSITHLPKSVCSLYNLQTLIVFGCHKLAKLPNNFLKLKKLRHFDIRDTPLWIRCR